MQGRHSYTMAFFPHFRHFPPFPATTTAPPKGVTKGLLKPIELCKSGAVTGLVSRRLVIEMPSRDTGIAEEVSMREVSSLGLQTKNKAKATPTSKTLL